MTRCMPDRPDLDEKLTVHTPRGNIQVCLLDWGLKITLIVLPLTVHSIFQDSFAYVNTIVADNVLLQDISWYMTFKLSVVKCTARCLFPSLLLMPLPSHQHEIKEETLLLFWLTFFFPPGPCSLSWSLVLHTTGAPWGAYPALQQNQSGCSTLPQTQSWPQNGWVCPSWDFNLTMLILFCSSNDL